MAHNPIQEQLLSRGLVDPGNVGVFGSPVSPIDVAEIERVTETLPPAGPPVGALLERWRREQGLPFETREALRTSRGGAAAKVEERAPLEDIGPEGFAGPGGEPDEEVVTAPTREPVRRADAGYVAKTGEAFEAQQEAARAREEFEVTEAAGVAGEAQGRIEYLEGERLQAMERAEEARTMKAEAEEKLQREVDFAAVNVDRGTYDEWARRLEDPGVADEEKAEIQRKIQKAKEIDPTAYLGKTMGQKVIVGILMAVAQAFGAYGAALGRTPNYAAQIIKSAIDRSIAGQRALFAGKQKALGVQRQIYGRMLDAYDGDEDKADAAAKVASYEMVKQRIAQISAKTASAEAQVSAQEMIARIEAEKIKEMHRIHDIDRRRALERLKAARVAVPGGRDLGAKDAKQLQGRISGIQKIERMRERFGKLDWTALVTQFIPGTNARNYDMRRKPFAMELAKAMFGSSQQAVREAERLEKALPKSWTWSSTANALLDSWVESATISYNNDLKALNLAGFDTSGWDVISEQGAAAPNPYGAEKRE